MAAHETIGPSIIVPNINLCHDTPQYPLGQLVWGKNGKAYRYVQFRRAVAYVVGHVVTQDFATDDDWRVSNDVSATVAGDHPIGVVFQDIVPTENQYGWVQCAGEAEVLIGSNAVIAGDFLKVDDTTDGAADEATEGTDHPFAVALETIADTAVGRVRLFGLI